MPTLARTLCAWEVVLATLRRKSVSWRGNPLSERDLNTFTEAIVMCSLHLTDISSRYGGIGSDREIIAWANFVASLDISDLASFLSDVVPLVRNVHEATTYSWFKRQLSNKYPFVGSYCAPIREALSSFLEDPSPDGFRVVYQFFSFLTHLTLVDIDIDLEGEYEEMEDYLRTIHYPTSIITGMNAIMREWLKDFSVTEENFFPSHGPKAIAEQSATGTQCTKYRYLGTDQLVNYVFGKYAGVDVTTYYPFTARGLERTSKLVFVPKSMKTRRTISKEPATLMYLQQGVEDVLVDYIHSHSDLSRHIDLRYQSKNALLAVQSSRSQSYATIDLSSASDTVTLTLAKAVFHGTPLLPYLIALRSTTVRLPSGKELVMEKYAPMGSALCFPIETLIFSCAVEYAVRRAQATYLGSFQAWRVYGDDIIVRDALSEDVILVLEALGFILNRSKTFSSPARFRESCGGEGYDGVDVTPLRISRRFQSVRGRITSSHAASYEGLIELANQCYTYKFSLLRAWIIQVLLGCSLGPPLFSEDGRGALISAWPDNYRARRRYLGEPSNRSHSWYQRQEIRVVVSCPKPKKMAWTADLEQARYFETLRLTRKRVGDMFEPEHRVHVPRGSLRPTLQKKWVEVPTFSVRADRYTKYPVY